LKAKVLGYEDIAFSTPNFAIAYFDKYYDLGTELQSQPTKDDDLYSMRYSNGIVYYNSTLDKAWFEDGNTFNNGSIQIVVLDDGANVITYNLCINEYCDYSIATDASGWAYETRTLYFGQAVFNDSYGHYRINVSTSANGYVGDDTNITNYGKHSFYDAGYWAIESDATGNHMIYLITNTTKKTSIDTTTQIIQSETTSGNSTIINLTSNYGFNMNTQTYPTTNSTGTFNQIKIWDGSAYVIASDYTNSSDCTSAEPTFSYNEIDGVGSVGVCIDDDPSADGIISRVEFPKLSEQSYLLEMQEEEAAEEEETTGGSNVGAPSSSGAPISSPTTPSTGRFWDRLTAGETAQFEVDDTITNIEFTLNQNLENVELYAASMYSTEVEPADDVVYKYLSINAPIITGSVIDSASISFAVDTTWINTFKIKKDSIRLERYISDEWVPLTTILTSETNNKLTFRASTPGFSYFVIRGESELPIEEIEEIKAEESAKLIPEKTIEFEFDYWSIALIVVVIIAISAYLIVRGHGKKLEEKYE
jgi:PGF-pre-PGF domain-containing protein